MKKVIITVVVIALLASICVFTLSGCSKLNEWKDKFIELVNPEDGSSNETEEGAFTVIVDEKQNEAVIQEGNGIVLETVRLSSEGVEVDGNAYVKVITATVYPEDLSNRYVNWDVFWGENPKSDDVSNYITYEVLTVFENEQANVVTNKIELRCIQGFEGSTIIVEATAFSGVSSTCICAFEGAPYEDLCYMQENNQNYGVNTNEIYSFTAGEHYIDFVLDNPVGDVGSSYGNYEITRIVGSGRFYVNTSPTVNGVVQTGLFGKPIVTEQLVDLSGRHSYSGFNYVGSDGSIVSEESVAPYTISYSDYIDVSISNQKLKLNIKDDEKSKLHNITYASDNSISLGVIASYSRSYIDPVLGEENPHFIITVTETVSGIEFVLHVDPISKSATVSMVSNLTF